MIMAATSTSPMLSNYPRRQRDKRLGGVLCASRWDVHDRRSPGFTSAIQQLPPIRPREYVFRQMFSGKTFRRRRRVSRALGSPGLALQAAARVGAPKKARRPRRGRLLVRLAVAQLTIRDDLGSRSRRAVPRSRDGDVAMCPLLRCDPRVRPSGCGQWPRPASLRPPTFPLDLRSRAAFHRAEPSCPCVVSEFFRPASAR
jgi:hypothetical protein